MKVLVLGGGISVERDVSLRSADAVRKGLAVHHEVEFLDWDSTADWLTKNASRFDVIFPILHGGEGEDGSLQKLLEELGVPYVGTDSEHSKLCMNKDESLKILQYTGVKVPQGRVVNFHQYNNDPLFDMPHVLKPVTGGSSIDTFILQDIAMRDIDAVNAAFEIHRTLLLEPFISGVEITVPILDGAELPVIEIIPPEGATFDYVNKYNGATQELCPPVNVSIELQGQAVELARLCHDALGCRDISRVDMIIRDNELFVLEVNTLPGLTDQSLFPRAAGVAGMTMVDLTDRLAIMAYNRKDTT